MEVRSQNFEGLLEAGLLVLPAGHLRPGKDRWNRFWHTIVQYRPIPGIWGIGRLQFAGLQLQALDGSSRGKWLQQHGVRAIRGILKNWRAIISAEFYKTGKRRRIQEEVGGATGTIGKIGKTGFFPTGICLFDFPKKYPENRLRTDRGEGRV